MLIGQSNLLLLVAAFALVLLAASVLRHFGVLRSEHARVLNWAIINITLPAFVFSALTRGDLRIEFLYLPLVGWAVMLALLGAAYVLGKRLALAPATLGGFLVVSAVGNTGYLGYPVLFAVSGHSGLLGAVVYDIGGTALFMFTVGLYVCRRYGIADPSIPQVRWYELLLFPATIAFLIGLALRPLPLPAPAVEVVGLIGQATIPLAMLSIGASLHLGHVRRYPSPLAVSVALKLAVSPLLAAGLLAAIGADDGLGTVAILQAAMPAAMMSVVFGGRFGLDTDFLASSVLITTVLAIVTLPAARLLLL